MLRLFYLFAPFTERGDWEQYWRFYLKQEHKRNHACLYKDGIPLMKRVQARCSTNSPALAIPV